MNPFEQRFGGLCINLVISVKSKIVESGTTSPTESIFSRRNLPNSEVVDICEIDQEMLPIGSLISAPLVDFDIVPKCASTLI